MSIQTGHPVSGVTSKTEANSQLPANPTAGVISVDWTTLVELIRAGDDHGMEQLYRVFDRGVRYFLARRLGSRDLDNLDNKVHDVFVTVVRGVQRGELREPESLVGFVRTAALREAGEHIDHSVYGGLDESHPDAAVPPVGSDGKRVPEQTTRERQRAEVMKRVLLSLSRRDRDILERFYLKLQKPEQICAETSLKETQFRLLKSRVQERFGEFAKGENTKKPLATETIQPITRSATA